MSVYPARTPSTLNTSPQTAETMIEAIETLVPVATGYLDAAFHFGIGVGFILFGHGAGPENGIEPDGIKRGCKLSLPVASLCARASDASQVLVFQAVSPAIRPSRTD